MFDKTKDKTNEVERLDWYGGSVIGLTTYKVVRSRISHLSV